MNPRSGTDLALDIAAVQAGNEREYRKHLTWWQRFILRLVFRDGLVLALLKARFEAHALRKWAWNWDDRCKREIGREEREAARQLLMGEPTQQSVVHFLPQPPDDTPTPVRPMPTKRSP